MIRVECLEQSEGVKKRAPMVGIVVTTSPSFSLYKIVVFPAASRPTCIWGHAMHRADAREGAMLEAYHQDSHLFRAEVIGQKRADCKTHGTRAVGKRLTL